MYLWGWKYEGRKISDKLHEQILCVIEVLNDKEQSAGRNWKELQEYIAEKLEVKPGQVRTIKCMMEQFDIIKKGVLHAGKVPDEKMIYTENGRIMAELLAAEKIAEKDMTECNAELIKEIRSIYRLHYQKVLADGAYSYDGKILHPLRATLKALKKYDYLDYWEWYILNTFISSDDNAAEEDQLDKYINEYRRGKLHFKKGDIMENKLSHVYIVGNFEYAGLVSVAERNEKMKVTLNEDCQEIIDEILK